MASLQSNLALELWKPFLLRLVAYQCLLYEVELPVPVAGSAEVIGSTRTVPYTPEDEPALAEGATSAGSALMSWF